MATGREGDVLVELHQTVRVTSQKETGEPSAAGRRPGAITTAGQDGDSLPFINTGRGANPVDAQSSGGGVGGWLVAFEDESNERLRCIQERKQPKIQRVSSLLRDVETNKPFFEPKVVSLGPYHHGQQKFAAMEEIKRAAAARFAGGEAVPMCVFYNKVKSVVSAARKWYADKFEDINDEDFAIMMFIDGCFILHFIDCCMNVENRL
ncbi:hypothetical protein Taro_040174 [Colocasia esculenta]|uniref:Uncharacterized protein n=1 Tax=Colocasia esculenta TaxID=4460 RepID=A0A843WS94_COLES|nr:hypothetical protein [Colocasia esculenta]